MSDIVDAEWDDEDELPNTVGASNVAALFGLSPFQSEYGLFCEFVGLTTRQEDNERLRAGRWLEVPILEQWKHNAGRPGFRHNTDKWMSPAYPGLHATPDAIEYVAGRLTADADVKTVQGWQRDDWRAGTPEYYVLQKQAQNMCTGAPGGFLIAMFGLGDPKGEWIEADPRAHREISSRVAVFMQRVRGELPPPEIDGHKATTAALAAQPVKAEAIELGAEVREWSDELATIEAAARDLDKRYDLLRNKIRAALGANSTGVFVDGSGFRIIQTKKGQQMRRIKGKDAIKGDDSWAEQ